MSRSSATGVFQGKWGSEGSGDSEFRLPVDVAIDSNGAVYVLDSQSIVRKFSGGIVPVEQSTLGTTKAPVSRKDSHPHENRGRRGGMTGTGLPRPSKPTSKGLQIGLWVLQVLLATFSLLAGLNHGIRPLDEAVKTSP
mgnify:CR=1 FL=1